MMDLPATLVPRMHPQSKERRVSESDTTALYGQLSEHFEQTYQLKKGGTALDYLTLEQVVSRLNAVLGVDGWEFHIRAHGNDDKHCWVHGQMTVYLGTRDITREQFGECSMNPGMAIGDARKGACSDALKKCASLFGVGLYLQSKEEHAHSTARSSELVFLDAPLGPTSIACADCGTAIKDSKRQDGSVWTATEKAEYSKGKNGRVLCYPCTQGRH